MVKLKFDSYYSKRNMVDFVLDFLHLQGFFAAKIDLRNPVRIPRNFFPLAFFAFQRSFYL